MSFSFLLYQLRAPLQPQLASCPLCVPLDNGLYVISGLGYNDFSNCCVNSRSLLPTLRKHIPRNSPQHALTRVTKYPKAHRQEPSWAHTHKGHQVSKKIFITSYKNTPPIHSKLTTQKMIPLPTEPSTRSPQAPSLSAPAASPPSPPSQSQIPGLPSLSPSPPHPLPTAEAHTGPAPAPPAVRSPRRD